MKRFIRCAAVLIAISSWIAVSNHCAFAAVASQTNARQSKCPFHSKPEKQNEQSSNVQCCRILRAVVLAKGKPWARDEMRFDAVSFPIATDAVVACQPRVAVPLLLDTGPPGAFSFAELILQRSLLAHAPPFAG